MLPKFYQTHFQNQLTRSVFLVWEIVLNLYESEKQVRLERLARVFPYPLITQSRRPSLQRFLDLPQLTLTCLWFPLITYWLTTYCQPGQKLSFAIAPSLWVCMFADDSNGIIVSKPKIWCWRWLAEWGITAGTSLYFQGIKVRKTKPSAGFDVACKWKRNYQGWTVNE